MINLKPIREALERITEQRDSGRHDGLEERSPALSDIEMLWEAGKALAHLDAIENEYAKRYMKDIGYGKAPLIVEENASTESVSFQQCVREAYRTDPDFRVAYSKYTKSERLVPVPFEQARSDIRDAFIKSTKAVLDAAGVNYVE